jgi:hypothetical protein
MDISETLAPASDQLDAIELVTGPRVFTIANVSRGSDEQPVNVHFADFPRPWRPSKGMRRVLAACWGSDASQWAGRRVELFFDPDVTFGKDTPGGTRIRALSHLDKPKSVPLLVSRGKSATFRVQPLPDLTPEQRIATLRAEYRGATDERKEAIKAEVATLQGQPAPEPAQDVEEPPAEPAGWN